MNLYFIRSIYFKSNFLYSKSIKNFLKRYLSTKNSLIVPLGERTESQIVREKYISSFVKNLLLSKYNINILQFHEIDNNIDAKKAENFARDINALLTKDSSNLNDILRQTKINYLSLPSDFGGYNFNIMMLSRIIESLSHHVEYCLTEFIPTVLYNRSILYGANETIKKNIFKENIKIPKCVDLGLERVYDKCFKSIVTEKENCISIRDENDSKIVCKRDSNYLIFRKTSDGKHIVFMIDSKELECYFKFENNIYRLEDLTINNFHLLDQIDSELLTKKIYSIKNIMISVMASSLIKLLVKNVNIWISKNFLFGKYLRDFQNIQKLLSHMALESYISESVSYFVAGFYDEYPNNEFYLESALSKLKSLECLDRTLKLFYELSGTKLIFDASVKSIIKNIEYLLNEEYNPEEKIIVGQECLKYNEINKSSKDFKPKFVKRLMPLLGYFNIETSITDDTEMIGAVSPGQTYFVNSIKFALQSRVSNLLDIDDRFYKSLSKLPEITKELQKETYVNNSLVHYKCGVILMEILATLSILTRSTRSISIGLRNHEHEISITEMHMTHLNKSTSDFNLNIDFLFDLIDGKRDFVSSESIFNKSS